MQYFPDFIWEPQKYQYYRFVDDAGSSNEIGRLSVTEWISIEDEFDSLPRFLPQLLEFASLDRVSHRGIEWEAGGTDEFKSSEDM